MVNDSEKGPLIGGLVGAAASIFCMIGTVFVENDTAKIALAVTASVVLLALIVFIVYLLWFKKGEFFQ